MDVNWNDPNLLIGGKNTTHNEIQILSKINSAKEAELIAYINKQVTEAHNSLIISHRSGFEEVVNYIVIEEQPKAPVTILKSYKHQRIFSWILDTNAEKWQFVLDRLVYIPKDNPSQWRMEEFIREMSFWRLKSDLENNDPVNGHYTGLALWHMFDETMSGEEKDKMREILYCTNLIELKPYYDFSIAKRRLAKNIYPLSELAQRAADENHLWFCMEYSEYLNSLPDERKVSKNTVRTQTTEVIRNYKAALNAGKSGIEYPTLPTIDLLQREGEDWRLWVRELILSDAIRLCWEGNIDETKDIEYHCRQYLNAWAHYNGIVGHRKGHNLIRSEKKAKPSGGRGRPRKARGGM